ncbi:ABC transporter substrate-binding protein [Aquabacterium sp. OR-4]|uniref:ABC transporter substrate-binding protein n=1 Tax=Aquabacterium sp. OR-4 TaxID=2978127 RepID=UPI0021B1F598|nr:ABC transporter substrate-binding protein [Aquabacterium sp. OR-4]MDT7836152.1 ABC transporter substrate-binding protein [Aquabacterium sp. OR-4]
MTRRQHLLTLAASALVLASAGAQAQDTVKVGVILPMTGPSATTGKQIDAAIKLWLAQSGGKAGGKKVEVIIKDDAGVADTTRRLAQELVVNDKVVALAGFGLTPLALATAPIATQSKTPMVVMAAATSSITEASPYIVRSSFTLPQAATAIAEWAAKNKIRKVVSLVADYGPGNDAEKFFASQFQLNGGVVVEKLRTPLRGPDFAPVLQKVRDAQPDALFVFLPSGQGAQFMKQFGERGLDKAGIRLIGTGDVTDDDQLNDMGDVALGVVNAHHYSAAHPSAANKKFVADFQAAAKFRPNFMAVGGYDGMRVIFKALEATKGAGGEALLNAMKGQIFESPRGPVLIDAQTRDIVQDIYIRKVERKDGQLWNIEFDVQKQVKDPGKSK